jgi:hypothetical protein
MRLIGGGEYPSLSPFWKTKVEARFVFVELASYGYSIKEKPS